MVRDISADKHMPTGYESFPELGDEEVTGLPLLIDASSLKTLLTERMNAGRKWSVVKLKKHKSEILVVLLGLAVTVAMVFFPQIATFVQHHPGYTAAIAGGFAGALVTGGVLYAGGANYLDSLHERLQKLPKERIDRVIYFTTSKPPSLDEEFVFTLAITKDKEEVRN